MQSVSLRPSDESDYQLIGRDFKVEFAGEKKFPARIREIIKKEFAGANAERKNKGRKELTNDKVLVVDEPKDATFDPNRTMRCSVVRYDSFVAGAVRPEEPELRQQKVSVAGIVEPAGAPETDPFMLVGLRSDDVFSHKNRLMTVPAGAHEPGRTVEQHTLKELEEEANIEANAVSSFEPIALVTHNQGKTVEILSRIGTRLTPQEILAGHAGATDKDEHQKLFFVRSSVLLDPERLQAFTDYILRQVSSLDGSPCRIDLEQPVVPCLPPMAQAYRESLQSQGMAAEQGAKRRADWFCLEDAPDDVIERAVAEAA